ncbi:MAG: GYD domain-containing protein [bacterium]|nr:GYD domain-containing protein [bacterium]
MKKYLVKGTYNSDGAKGLIQEGGSGRRTAIEKMLEEMGGKLESFYYAFGEEDVYVIVELPDDISATAVWLTVNAAGLVKISMTVLLTAADIDAASKKSVSYRAPGKN